MTRVQAWKKDDISGKWANTAWAKKLAAKKVRAGLNDFQRFTVAVNKKKVCITSDVGRVCGNTCSVMIFGVVAM